MRKEDKHERSNTSPASAGDHPGESETAGANRTGEEKGSEADPEETKPGSPGMGNPERGINGAMYDPVDSDLPDAAERYTERTLRGGENKNAKVCINRTRYPGADRGSWRISLQGAESVIC